MHVSRGNGYINCTFVAKLRVRVTENHVAGHNESMCCFVPRERQMEVQSAFLFVAKFGHLGTHIKGSCHL
jgi:hypothetical protein